MRASLALAAAATAFAAYGYFALGLVMLPDFDLYTDGALGLYPSPLGRLLGAAGPTPFALASIACVGAIVLLAAATARRNGCPAWWGAAALVGSPALLWLAYAGIDPIGVALLAAGLLWASPWLVAAAALVHLSLAPFALLLLPRATWAARFAIATVAGVSAIALALTPYSGVVYGLFHPDALMAAALAFLAAILLSLPGGFIGDTFHDQLWKRAVLIGVVECAAQHHLQVRYLLPAAVIAAMNVRQYPVPSLKRERPPATATSPTTDAMRARRGLSSG